MDPICAINIKDVKHATALISIAQKFDSDIYLSVPERGYRIDATSIMGVMMIVNNHPINVHIIEKNDGDTEKLLTQLKEGGYLNV